MSEKWRLMTVLLLGAAVLVAFSPRRSLGTTVVKMSLTQMTQSASLIVEGVVAGKQARWDEAHRNIITEVSVTVSRTLKGRTMSPVKVRVLGGEVDGQGMFVAGAPRFEVGQEVLLLLETHPTKDYRVIGFHQGKFDIITDAQTGRKLARGVAGQATAPLSDIEAQIRAIVGGSQP